MKIVKACSTCILDHMCNSQDVNKKNKYNSANCLGWMESKNYFNEVCNSASWYVKIQCDKKKLSFSELTDLINKDEKNKKIDINIYDAIFEIYDLNFVQLSELLGVKIGVIARAYYKFTTPKRVVEFSNKLCLPIEFFDTISTENLEEIEKCKKDFLSRNTLNTVNTKNLEWKEKLIDEIINLLNCSKDDAIKLLQLSNFKWNDAINITSLKEEELILLKLVNERENNGQLVSLEYKINFAGKPILSCEFSHNNLLRK